MKTTHTARKRAVEPPVDSGQTKPRRRPKAAPGPLYRKTDITPDDLFKALGDLPRLRNEAAAEIERLIDFLDMADRLCDDDTEVDECDLEDGADAEPSLCGLGAHDMRRFLVAGVEDGEQDQEDEPSLGSLACIAVKGGQENWAAGNPQGNDLEGDAVGEDDEDGHDAEVVCEDEGAEHDGAEPDEADAEPSLGWSTSGAWGSANGKDLELAGSCLTVAAKARFKVVDRCQTNRDGMHVDAERGVARDSRRLRNLS